MKKCLKIILIAARAQQVLSMLAKQTKKFNLEGTAQLVNNEQLKVIVCGEKDEVESFLDLFHEEAGRVDAQEVQVEPFSRDKDYRGVFRVIE